MHYNAKRVFAIASLQVSCPYIAYIIRLHVCPSVASVDQEHTGWNSWKLIKLLHGQLAQHHRFSWSKGHSLTAWGTWENFEEVGGERRSC